MFTKRLDLSKDLLETAAKILSKENLVEKKHGSPHDLTEMASQKSKVDPKWKPHPSYNGLDHTIKDHIEQFDDIASSGLGEFTEWHKEHFARHASSVKPEHREKVHHAIMKHMERSGNYTRNEENAISKIYHPKSKVKPRFPDESQDLKHFYGG